MCNNNCRLEIESLKTSIGKYEIDNIEPEFATCYFGGDNRLTKGIGTKLLHCGNCGKCSTEKDAVVFVNTSNTLTSLLKGCITNQIVGGNNISKCIDDKIGLSKDCKACFLKNIECTVKNCAFLCAYETIFNIPANNETKCIKCDEKYCGDKFKECAGMTRRRAGLISGIKRSAGEICEYNIETQMENRLSIGGAEKRLAPNPVQYDDIGDDA